MPSTPKTNRVVRPLKDCAGFIYHVSKQQGKLIQGKLGNRSLNCGNIEEFGLTGIVWWCYTISANSLIGITFLK
jgi:hypothetical protein